jgi:ABC-type sulfate transport system substrate-binding protein
MSDRKVYNVKVAPPGLDIVCGSCGSGTDLFVTTGSGFTFSIVGTTVVIAHDNFQALVASSVQVTDPASASTNSAFILSSAPTTGTTTIQMQSSAGTAGDFLTAGAAGLRIDFVLYFRNTDLTV